VTAALLTEDVFRMDQRPLDLILLVGDAVQWRWSGVQVDRIGQSLTIQVEGRPEVRELAREVSA
jgi:hypothetical protein